MIFEAVAKGKFLVSSPGMYEYPSDLMRKLRRETPLYDFSVYYADMARRKSFFLRPKEFVYYGEFFLKSTILLTGRTEEESIDEYAPCNSVMENPFKQVYSLVQSIEQENNLTLIPSSIHITPATLISPKVAEHLAQLEKNKATNEKRV